MDFRRIRLKSQTAGFRATANIRHSPQKNSSENKLRALLQRRKNRDLFDLHMGLQELSLCPRKLIDSFEHYLMLEGKPITRAMAEQRMLEKLTRSLTEDIEPLLPPGITFQESNALAAFEHIWSELIVKFEGRAVEADRSCHR